MKKFREFSKEVNESVDANYDDDMTIRELKIACYTSQKIIDMIENGQIPERWNLSKVTLAADYLSSVYTFMQSNKDDSDMFFDYPNGGIEYSDY